MGQSVWVCFLLFIPFPIPPSKNFPPKPNQFPSESIENMSWCSSSSHSNRSTFLSFSFFFFLSLLFLVQLAPVTAAQSDSSAGGGGFLAQEVEKRAIHIVYTERPEEEEPEAYHIRTLTSVLGSEESARDALIYSYRTVASGFSANLTPKQVAEIAKLPGVLQVVPSRTVTLDSGRGIAHV